MKKQLANPIIIAIIVLGIIGIIINFNTFLREIITTIIILGIIYLGYRWYINSNKSSKANNRQAYSKAVKQSRKKYAPSNKSTIDLLQRKSSSKQSPSQKKKRKSPSSHLTVIQGEKGKKKGM